MLFFINRSRKVKVYFFIKTDTIPSLTFLRKTIIKRTQYLPVNIIPKFF